MTDDIKRKPGEHVYTHPWLPVPVEPPETLLLGWFESGDTWTIRRSCGDFVLAAKNGGFLEIIQYWDRNSFGGNAVTFNKYIRQKAHDYKPFDHGIPMTAITLRNLIFLEGKYAKIKQK
jgi:hypothetical protein